MIWHVCEKNKPLAGTWTFCFLRFCCYQHMNMLNMTCILKHLNCKNFNISPKFVPHLYYMNFVFPFNMLISKIRLVFSANSWESLWLPLTASSRAIVFSFLFLKWNAGYRSLQALFMTLYLWNCLETMECEDGFYCSCVGLLVFASMFYMKKWRPVVQFKTIFW